MGAFILNKPVFRFIEDIGEHVAFNSSTDSVAANKLLNKSASAEATQTYLDDHAGPTDFKTPSHILEYVAQERFYMARQRSDIGRIYRVKNGRRIEMVGEIPSIVVELVIEHVEEYEAQDINDWEHLFSELPRRTGWTQTLEALSLTHRAFTSLAQRSMRRSLFAEGFDLRGLSFSPACGPWTKKLHLNASMTTHGCKLEPLFPVETTYLSFFWTHILRQTPYLTTLVFHMDFQQDEIFRLFTAMVSQQRRLEVLHVTDREVYLPYDMNYESLADFFVSISKLEKLKYLGLKSHRICGRHVYPTLREDLKPLAPPSSLKTIVLSHFYIEEVYSIWLLEARGDYALESLAVSGEVACPSVLQVALASVRRFKYDNFYYPIIIDNEPFYLDELLSACPSLLWLHISIFTGFHECRGTLPSRLEILEIGSDAWYQSWNKSTVSTVVEAELPGLIERSYSENGSMALDRIVINQGLNLYHYVELGRTCEKYGVSLEIKPTGSLKTGSLPSLSVL